MAFQQQYEDVLVTQMNSLWIDDPTPPQAPVLRKRLSIYNRITSDQESAHSYVAAPVPVGSSAKGCDKKKHKWLKKFNVVINSYNKPISGTVFEPARRRSHSGRAQQLRISTPYGFNHVGHVSDMDTFGLENMFDLNDKETEIVCELFPGSKQEQTTSTQSVQEQQSTSSSPDLANDKGKKRVRAISSFTTMPIESTVSNSKSLPRSTSEKSVNSSLLFSRSNSMNTMATTANLVSPILAHRKDSLSENSLRSLMELEKQHQRSISSSSSSGTNNLLTKLKSISSQSSYLDQFRTNSVMIKEEEEEERLDIPELSDSQEDLLNYQFPSPIAQNLESVSMTPPPLVPRKNSLDWNESPLSFMRSSWIYKDTPSTSETQREDFFANSDNDSSVEDLMQASFRAGRYTRRSRLSLQQHSNVQNNGSCLLMPAAEVS